MKRIQEHKVFYSILGAGAVGTFLGHGMWAIDAKESFVGLLTGSLKNVFGYHLSDGTAATVVRVIGGVDIAVAALFALFIVGAIQGRGALYSAAYSRTAIVLAGWGVFWGFLTAFSRITAAETWYPEVWDWVERAPNFMLPAALLFTIVRHRTIDVPTHLPERELTQV